jgi:3-deoxy-D-manno-octulosonic-acid transferase
VLEAAVWNVPVIIGPNNKKFQEAQELIAAGGCFEITGYPDFEQLMQRFEADALYLSEAGKRAGEYVKDRAGATTGVLTQISQDSH